MHIADLMLRLADEKGRDVEGLLQRLVFWAAIVVENWRVLPSPSGDPLNDAPVPQGAKRARRLDLVLVDTIGKAAGSREVARSGAKVVSLMQRFRRSGRLKLSAATGNALLGRRAARYCYGGSHKFRTGLGSVVHAALDATRMDKRETMFAAIFCTKSMQGIWCPPQVLLGLWGGAQGLSRTVRGRKLW